LLQQDLLWLSWHVTLALFPRPCFEDSPGPGDHWACRCQLLLFGFSVTSSVKLWWFKALEGILWIHRERLAWQSQCPCHGCFVEFEVGKPRLFVVTALVWPCLLVSVAYKPSTPWGSGAFSTWNHWQPSGAFQMTHEMQQLLLANSFRSSQSVLRNNVEVPLSGLARLVVNNVSATFLVEFNGLLAGWLGSRDPLGTNPWDRRSTWCCHPLSAAFLRSVVVLSMH
jgi:hypothetical protein